MSDQDTLSGRQVTEADLLDDEWQLTPSNTRVLGWWLATTWGMSGGLLVVIVAGSVLIGLESALAGEVTTTLSTITWVLGSVLTIGIVAGGLWLLRETRVGRTVASLRLPEPTDPSRSVLEHASLPWLVASALAGAVIHAGGFALMITTGTSAFGYLLPMGAVYLALVGFRWWLPTTGRRRGETVTVRSYPSGTTTLAGGWSERLHTTATLEREALDRGRKVTVGAVTFIVATSKEGRTVGALVPRRVLEDR